MLKKKTPFKEISELTGLSEQKVIIIINKLKFLN